jgi:hypothetical protein
MRPRTSKTRFVASFDRKESKAPHPPSHTMQFWRDEGRAALVASSLATLLALKISAALGLQNLATRARGGQHESKANRTEGAEKAALGATDRSSLLSIRWTLPEGRARSDPLGGRSLKGGLEVIIDH